MSCGKKSPALRKPESIELRRATIMRAGSARWTPRSLCAYSACGQTGARGKVTMVALFKALPFGIFFTIIVALFMGSGGATGGTLAIRHVEVMDIPFYWSWYLFLGGTGITWALLLMMGD